MHSATQRELQVSKQRTGKNLKVVHKRQMLVVAEDGSFNHAPVNLYLDSTGDSPSFVYEMPVYLVEALGCLSQVADKTAEGAKREYESLVRRYHEHMLNSTATKIIFVHYKWEQKDKFESRQPDATVNIGVSYTVNFAVNGKVYEAKKKYQQKAGPFEMTVNDYDKPPILVPGHLHSYAKVSDSMPYSEELHAKLDWIINALNNAGKMLDELKTAKDQATAILAFGGPSVPALPAPSRERRAAPLQLVERTK